MLAALKRLFSPRRAAISARQWARRADRSYERRYEGGRTTRLNSAKHALAAASGTYNDDLEIDGPTLAKRVQFEAQNNGFVEGVITTHITDIVGPHGPTLEAQTEDKAWADAFERVWRDWFRCPSIDGATSGVELLRSAIRMMWSRGEFLWQFVAEDELEMANLREEDVHCVRGRLPLRVYDIHPRRLGNPDHGVLNNRIRLGIERTRLGRVLAYHVQDEWANDPATFPTLVVDRIPANVMIHGFLKSEPGQLRGAPWLASSIEPISDLREYDAGVLDAVRAAADYALYAYTDNGDLPAIEVNGSVSIKRRQMTFMPPTYKVAQLNPQQPSTRYVEHRHERLRELGRPVGMPLMLVLSDAAKHNYSSARLDMQVYQRFIRCIQAWLARVGLNVLARELANEARMDGLLPGPMPADLKLIWHWQATPHVDPGKEANAAMTRLESGQATLHEVLAELGVDYDSFLATLKREIADIKAIGDELEVNAVHPFLRSALAKAISGEGPEPDDEDAPNKSDDDEQDDDAEEKARDAVFSTAL